MWSIHKGKQLQYSIDPPTLWQCTVSLQVSAVILVKGQHPSWPLMLLSSAQTQGWSLALPLLAQRSAMSTVFLLKPQHVYLWIRSLSGQCFVKVTLNTMILSHHCKESSLGLKYGIASCFGIWQAAPYRPNVWTGYFLWAPGVLKVVLLCCRRKVLLPISCSVKMKNTILRHSINLSTLVMWCLFIVMPV